MANLPADVVNQALDAIGLDIVIGDIEEGTREAQVCLRAYVQCVSQLLRAANWDFARRQQPLTMLADATGQTEGVGSIVPLPWLYEYKYPSDCLKVRFLPQNPQNISTGTPPGNIAVAQTPQMTGQGQPVLNGLRIIPARFVVSTDTNYLPDVSGAWWEIPGISPQGQTVILTNVQQAVCVYTAMVPYPNMWDPLFRAALVSYLASEVALPLWKKDKAFGLKVQGIQISLTKEKIKQARITDGNEGWYNTDHMPDWMRVRYSGPLMGRGYSPGGNGSIGILGYGYDTCGFADGSAF